MAELSRFFGIIIRMFPEHGGQHHVPHFHAAYQGEVASFSISPVGIMAGSLPPRQIRLVEAWAEIHQEELLVAWKAVERNERPNPIEPLR